MKKMRKYALLTSIVSLAACSQKIDRVTPTWARAISPDEGATVKIDFFRPNDYQTFKWEARASSTYRICFDVDMHFLNPCTFDMGTKDSLAIKNQDLLDALRQVWPDFSSIKRFFWRVEQNTGGRVETTWRYFSAILYVENFVDDRDGERYEARQFVVGDGSLMTVMAENLRAGVYADGSPLVLPFRVAESEDPIFNHKAGHYYSWATAIKGMSWEEAKSATLGGTPVQGICPDGWHMPSYAEIDKLREHLGHYDGGNKVKDPSYWKTTATIDNSSKMSIIASGFYWRSTSEVISNDLFSSYPVAGFWSATPYLQGLPVEWDTALSDDHNRAIAMTFYDDNHGINFQGYGIVPGPDNENRHYPVRCIMNSL
jgi:uncharacterized protein (TIGR02145 family)